MMVDTKRDSKENVFFSCCIVVSASVTAVAGTTTLAYFIFHGIRHTRIETLLDSLFRVLRGMVGSILNMDPMVAAWAYPLALGFIAVVGMLVYRHLNR